MPSTIFKDLWTTIQNNNVWQGEIKNLKKGGGYYWISTTITPEVAENGEIIGFLAVRQDITSEKELESNTKKLYEAEKLASLGEMIGNIAHQSRQPLSAISSSASSIKIENELDLLSKEDLANRMDLMMKKTSFLSETINTFRNFLKSDKEYKELILEDEIFDGLNVTSSTLKNHDINIINTINPEQKTQIKMVQGELPQVLVNILNNAKDILMEKKYN